MNILIINAHEPFGDCAKGELTQTFIDLAKQTLTDKGHNIDITETRSSINHDTQKELEKHMWADAIILQTPLYWMGTPWSYKKYMDEIYTAGMNGELCMTDGRVLEDPSKQYGTGGTRRGIKYMLSITMNAPEEAFNNPEQWFMQGKSIDDLFYPQHQNFRFFGMEPLPTFSAYDVLKNPKINKYFQDFKTHLNTHF